MAIILDIPVPEENGNDNGETENQDQRNNRYIPYNIQDEVYSTFDTYVAGNEDFMEDPSYTESMILREIQKLREEQRISTSQHVHLNYTQKHISADNVFSGEVLSCFSKITRVLDPIDDKRLHEKTEIGIISKPELFRIGKKWDKMDLLYTTKRVEKGYNMAKDLHNRYSKSYLLMGGPWKSMSRTVVRAGYGEPIYFVYLLRKFARKIPPKFRFLK